MKLGGLPILVLGLGESGLAMARWCLRQGARVTVADSRAVPPSLNREAVEQAGGRVICGPFAPELLLGVQLVCISPGLPMADALPQADPERLRQVLANLIDNGIKYGREGGRIVGQVGRPQPTLRPLRNHPQVRQADTTALAWFNVDRRRSKSRIRYNLTYFVNNLHTGNLVATASRGGNYQLRVARIDRPIAMQEASDTLAACVAQAI